MRGLKRPELIMSAKRKADEINEDVENKQQKLESKDSDDEVDRNEENGAVDSSNITENNDDSKDNTVDVSSDSENDKEPVKKTVADNEKAGTLLICGSINWDLTGRKVPPKGVKSGPEWRLWEPHVLSSFNGIRIRLVSTGCVSSHSIIVTEEGKAYALGRNEKGQLGVGDQVRRDVPTVIEALETKNIVGAGCGRNHTLLLTDDGTVYSCGENKMGQCGIGNQHPAVVTATPINYKGPPIVKVGCGGEFSMILDCKGILHSFGCPEYGQLGHNTDGKYFVTSTKLGFHCETTPKRIVCYVEKSKDGHISPVEVMEIIDFSCGANHTVAIDVKKRVFSWGWGGFGRLGHAEQKDEFIPRLLKYFDSQSRGVKSVHCGSSYSLALNDYGVLYLFGQTKRTGEANMYPKPVQDLSGWAIRSVGCGNTSIMIAADESVIAWGPSPTYGELGFGELRKSSTTPLEVKTLDGIYIHQVACGMGHSLLIARDQSEQDKAKLQKLPVFTP